MCVCLFAPNGVEAAVTKQHFPCFKSSQGRKEKRGEGGREIRNKLFLSDVGTGAKKKSYLPEFLVRYFVFLPPPPPPPPPTPTPPPPPRWVEDGKHLSSSPQFFLP